MSEELLKAKSDFLDKNYAASAMLLRKMVGGNNDVVATLNLALVTFADRDYHTYNEYSTYLNNMEIKLISNTNNSEVCKAHHLCFIYYNQAVIMYYLRNYLPALKKLEYCIAHIANLDVNFAQKISFLITDLYVAVNQFSKALSMLTQLDKQIENLKPTESAGRPGTQEPSVVGSGLLLTKRARMIYSKVLLSLTQKSIKDSKKDVKEFMLYNSQSYLSFFLKANHMLLRQNFPKVFRLLELAQKQIEQSPGATYLNVLYHNNWGVTLLLSGKPYAAWRSAELALQHYKKMEAELRSYKLEEYRDRIPLQQHGRLCFEELCYNAGVTALLCDRPELGFRLLSTRYRFNDPRFLMRKADCCIAKFVKMIAKTSKIGSCDTELVSSLNFFQTGHNIYMVRYIVEQQKFRAAAMTQDDDMSLTKADKMLSIALDVINQMLKLLVACPTDEEHARYPFIKKEELESMRIHILLQQAYISLWTEDFYKTIRVTDAVLADKSPLTMPVHRFYAHVYAAEASIKLDRVQEAVKHLQSELGGVFVPQSEHLLRTSARLVSPQVFVPTCHNEVQVAMKFNLASAFAYKGNYEAARKTLNQVIANNPPAALMARANILSAYLDITKGDVATALCTLKGSSWPSDSNPTTLPPAGRKQPAA